MNIHRIFDKAFQAGNQSVALREALIELRSKGVSKEELLNALQSYRNRVKSEADEDLILDFMDNLYGHTSKESRIE